MIIIQGGTFYEVSYQAEGVGVLQPHSASGPRPTARSVLGIVGALCLLRVLRGPTSPLAQHLGVAQDMVFSVLKLGPSWANRAGVVPLHWPDAGLAAPVLGPMSC